MLGSGSRGYRQGGNGRGADFREGDSQFSSQEFWMPKRRASPSKSLRKPTASYIAKEIAHRLPPVKANLPICDLSENTGRELEKGTKDVSGREARKEGDEKGHKVEIQYVSRQMRERIKSHLLLSRKGVES